MKLFDSLMVIQSKEYRDYFEFGPEEVERASYDLSQAIMALTHIHDLILYDDQEDPEELILSIWKELDRFRKKI